MKEKIMKKGRLASLVLALAFVICLLPQLSQTVMAATTYTIYFEGNEWKGDIEGVKSAKAGDTIEITGGKYTYLWLSPDIDGWYKREPIDDVPGSYVIPDGCEVSEVETYYNQGFYWLVIDIRKEHTHSFATTWTNDATNHWHACTAEGNTDACLTEADAAKVAHTWSNGKCSVCEKVCEHDYSAATGKCKLCAADDPDYVPIKHVKDIQAGDILKAGDRIGFRSAPDRAYEAAYINYADTKVRASDGKYFGNYKSYTRDKALSFDEAYFTLEAAHDVTEWLVGLNKGNDIYLYPVNHETHSYRAEVEGNIGKLVCDTSECILTNNNIDLSFELKVDDIQVGEELNATIDYSEDWSKYSYIGIELSDIKYYKHTTLLEAAPTAAGDYTAKATVLGETIIKNFSINCVSHAWDNGKITKDATCTAAGEKTFTCTACGETKKDEIKAKGHTEDKVAAKAATCTEKGLTEGKKCSVCGDTLVAQKEVAAKGHKEVKVDAKAATCTEKGLTEGKKCSVCGKVTVAQEEVAAKGHTWDAGVVTTEATTEKEGVKTYTCTVCKETKTEAIATLEKKEETKPAEDKTKGTAYKTGSHKSTINVPTTYEKTGVTYKVTSIKENAFHGSYVKKVDLPSSIKKINSKAFKNDNKLRSVKINSKKITVSKTAFKGIKKKNLAKIKVTVTKKMSKKDFKALKANLVKQGLKAENIVRK